MPKFRSNQLMQTEQCNNLWRVKGAPADTSVESLLQSETWAHCSFKFAPYDEIVVVPEGGPYRAHLIVMDAGKNFAKLRLLGVILLNETSDATLRVPVPDALPEALPADAPVEVKWNGPTDKYTVLRKGDGEKLKTGIAVKAEAIAWAMKHIASMAA